MPEYLLAHDLGTSGNKATLYTPEGRLIASSTSSYPTRFFNANWAEQEPEDWWRAVCLSTTKLLAASRCAPSDVAVVALSGQMMGCTPVDRLGNALRPSILYCDQRAVPQTGQILARLPMARFYGIVGHRASQVYSLEKLMWIRDNQPDVFARTFQTLCAKDYINCRLTGRMATDYSDASGTNAFDLNTFRWSEEILDAAGIAADLFPEALPSTTILGTITADAARQTGLLEGTPVAAGGGDGSCAGVGAGCIRPGIAYHYLGSSAWIALTVKKPIVDDRMRTMNWAHCVPGYLHPSGSVQSAGSTHNWLKETLCRQEADQAAALGGDVYDLIDRAVAGTPAGSNGLLFLPYMLGERTPWWNPNARGTFLGLNLGTRREDMLRAVLEGITMNLGLIVDIFRSHVPIDSVIAIGGGARSGVWRQMMADVFGCRIDSLNVLEEATSMGAAVVGGVAVGLFPDFDAIHRFVHVEESVSPDPVSRDRYARLLLVFEKAYLSLVDVYDDLAKVTHEIRSGN
jgi:xylulokinase